MSHVPRRDDEDDVLGDVGRVVTDALEMAGHQDQVQRRLDGGRILQHASEQFPEDLRLEGVEPIVFVEHVLGELDVSADEGIERIAQHVAGDCRHQRDVNQLLHGRMARVAAGRLGDVHGEIAHPFEVGVDLRLASCDRQRIVREFTFRQSTGAA